MRSSWAIQRSAAGVGMEHGGYNRSGCYQRTSGHHDRAAARDPPRRAKVEVPRVPHDDDVRFPLLVPPEVALGAEHTRDLPDAEGPVLDAPDLAMALDDLDARAA